MLGVNRSDQKTQSTILLVHGFFGQTHAEMGRNLLYTAANLK